MLDNHIFLEKGVWVAHVVSALLVPPVELSPKIEAALGAKMAHTPMMVAAQQEKLLKKINLDGLCNWTPRNAAAAKELILAFHNIFTLDRNELGCTSAIEHEIHINNSEPFKEWFRHIPLPLLDEVRTLLRDMLDVGALHTSKSHTPVVQHIGISLEKGWNCVLLHGFLQVQHAYQIGLVPSATDTGSTGEYGENHTFFNNGL